MAQEQKIHEGGDGNPDFDMFAASVLNRKKTRELGSYLALDSLQIEQERPYQEKTNSRRRPIQSDDSIQLCSHEY
jgi:hypothetical protein